MGSWDETCTLTHLPIRAGQPVVTLATVKGPHFKTEGSKKNALLFGLPLEGKYDDYGGVEDLTNPALAEFSDQAFVKAGFYREHTFKGLYGTQTRRLIACHRKTLWGLEHDVKSLFYPEVGMRASEEKSYEPAASEKQGRAHKLTEAALKKLGDLLEQATLPESHEQAQDQIFDFVAEAFGAERAWPALHLLQRNGLYASKDCILMHKVAYDKVVAEFGRRRVSFYREKGSQPLRSFLSGHLDEWLAAYRAATARAQELRARLPETAVDLLLTRSSMRSMAEGKYIRPLSLPWEAPEHPLVGHFWGGAEPDEVLAVEDRERILDFLVFQWGRSYLRINFEPAGNGSQCEEALLPAEVFKATSQFLRYQGRLKSDFEGILHR